MVLSSIHRPLGHGAHEHPLRDAVEHRTYEALLAATGFVIVNLLKVAERRESHDAGHRRV